MSLTPLNNGTVAQAYFALDRLHYFDKPLFEILCNLRDGNIDEAKERLSNLVEALEGWLHRLDEVSALDPEDLDHDDDVAEM